MTAAAGHAGAAGAAAPRARKRIHLAARFPGGDGTAGRTDPRSRSRADFASFEAPARTAERGTFDFFLLAEEPRPHEHVGHPEPLTVLSALAAVTDRLGLAATADTTFNEPFELARRFATLDHLSAGRAAWHVVTSSGARTGENFRRGGFLDRAGRRTRAAEFVRTARELWDSWTPPVPGSPDGAPRPFAHSGPQFEIAGEFTVPRSPQGHPVIILAGECGEARESAARAADVLLTRGGTLEAGRAFYADTKARLAAYGRKPDDLKIMPGVTVVLGDSDSDTAAREHTAYDPDGPRFFTGTPETVAAEMDAFVSAGAADGFLLLPPPTPGGLDAFVDRVVPLLRERGALRTEYEGTTLRSHLGLPDPVNPV
ncbi:LLM class flavin-dependent oxidoreductase [Streptomyces sp. NPDC088124]|uniref:LLM class flavin-dependent oxidoreductase n=1 Tax=Streptomyces sp. NPDC088124 TaxID=3154654 RepID=UPI003447EB22